VCPIYSQRDKDQECIFLKPQESRDLFCWPNQTSIKALLPYVGVGFSKLGAL
jgi:hypothetical protein